MYQTKLLEYQLDALELIHESLHVQGAFQYYQQNRLTELDLNETRNRGDIAASILDLSREQKKTQDGEAQSDLSTPATDDELDIPAFLRRQAN